MKKLSCAVAVLAVSTGQADTIYVDDDNCPGPGDGSKVEPYCSIQTAIDNAVDTDEIIVVEGTYFEAINFVGKAITLRSANPDDPDVVAATIIDGTGFFHVVQCVSGEGPDTVLSGFVITGGNANGSSPDDRGGGMYNFVSSPMVTNCSFSGNSASSWGGGMHNRDGSPTVTRCSFSGNTAQLGGGMFNVNSSPTVSNCAFSENTATASSGGGMGNIDGSSPTVSNCAFIGNTSGNNGGGMANMGEGNSPTVTNCTFSGNSATYGGGIYNSGSPTVTNCVLWGNSPNEISGIAPIVAYSNVQGGWPGTGNIDADPLFVDPNNGNLRLSPGSPCIDAGDNTAVPEDINTDLDGNPRFVDDPETKDTGNGDPPIVDMGAYEFQPPQACPWDCGDGDGSVDIDDFLAVIAQWGTEGTCDFDGGGVDINDFLAVIANWCVFP